ncbi:hypothetical protein P3512_23140 [Escherichia coli]|uniref:hypothetical protein n=1 Tax=Escherichia coli TaxID=562 RepID=UPI001999F696|nr:hypothetical protein [Escherichia coli]EFX6129889.1 hypothetical protein [Shigella boydii]MDF4126361.1 hypothetical protein [Escherichia coli]
MAKNKGICRNKKCSNPVSEFDEANALRLCDDHYKLWKRNKENRRVRNICRIISKYDKSLDREIFYGVRDAAKNKTGKRIIEDAKILHQCRASKQVRKSFHKGVLRSREWLNTQELLSRKHISVTGELFKFYIKDIIRLYCYKFLYSREYLNENAYKKRYQSDIHPRKVNVPILQLEVAWINNNCRSSDSSTDIIILPRMIRRMVVFNYTKINKQLEKLLGGIARKQTSERNKGGLYTRIKKESDFLSMDRFMVEIENIIRPERFPTSIYPVFSHSFIERELPLLNLARSQYKRAISKRVANSIFYTLQKTNVALWLYLEMFALVALIKLYTGKGFEFIKNMCVFIDYEKGIIKSTHEELLGEIKRNIQVNLKVNPDNFPELIDIYNSCFSENILSYDIQDGNFKWRS